jgi:hypothetical protein
MRIYRAFAVLRCRQKCKQSREICHGEGAVRGGFWRSVAVDFEAWFPRRGSGSRDHRSLAVAELAQPVDDICAGRVERVKDKLSFSVVEREVLRPSTEVVVDV